MQRIIDYSKKGLFASLPYLSSLATLDVKEIAKTITTQAREHYFQYNKLLEEIEKASIYYGELYDFNEYISNKKSIKKNLCSYKEFKSTFDKLEKMLLDLAQDGDIRKQLDEQQGKLNTLVDIYQIHNTNGYKSKAQKMADETFIKSYPNWYRFELNAMINSMNIALDDIMFELSVYQEEKHTCKVRPKIKMNVKEPELTKEEEAYLFDVD